MATNTFNKQRVKENLSLMKAKYKADYDYKDKETSEVAKGIISRQKEKISRERSIEDLQKKIKDNKYKKIKSIPKKIERSLSKLAGKRIKTKKVLRRSQASYKVSDNKVQGIFEDENRFFKGGHTNVKNMLFD